MCVSKWVPFVRLITHGGIALIAVNVCFKMGAVCAVDHSWWDSSDSRECVFQNGRRLGG